MAIDFSIAQPTDVVEASFTDDPFDVSRVAIKIDVTFGGERPDFLRFQLVDPAKQRVTLESTNQGLFGTIAANTEAPAAPIKDLVALTTNPAVISSVAEAFGQWTFVQIADGVFKATPKGSTVSDTTFAFYNVEVTTGEGRCGIAVAAVTGNTETPLKVLPVRKVNPALRIDKFTVTNSSIVANAATEVELSWATSGATEVRLAAPGESPGPIVAKDGNKRVTPTSTSTYTLTAKSDTGSVTGQVTVTVTDQLTVNGVVVSGEKVAATDTAATRVHVQGALKVDSALEAGGTASAGATINGKLTVHGDLAANGITGSGAVPASSAVTRTGPGTVAGVMEIQGAILMWNGSEAPSGWGLCNGSRFRLPDGSTCRTPDLQNRFVLGLSGTRALGTRDGSETVKLDKTHLPAHNHTASSTAAGSHSHTLDTKIDTGVGTHTALTGNPLANPRDAKTDSQGSHSHSITVNDSTGGDQPHDNMPPFVVLAFIIRLPDGATPV
jgi:microcystin-dependent protein